MNSRKKRKMLLRKRKRLGEMEEVSETGGVPADLQAYFINISLSLGSTKENEEEMNVLSSNALNEIDGNEIACCCDSTVSRVIEELLPYSSDEDFIRFSENYSKDLRRVFCDKIGSHVLQQCLVVGLKKYSECMSDPDREKLSSYMLRVSQFLLNNLDDFILNIYGNPVSRTVINVLCGYAVKGEIKPELCEESKIKDIPQEFFKVFRKFIDKILSMPQLDDLNNQTQISNFLHSIVSATERNEEQSHIVNKVMSSYEKNPIDLTSNENVPFVRLVEAIITVADERCLKSVYELMLERNLLELTLSRSGNFLVQKFIDHCNAEYFDKVFNELNPKMTEILEVEHSGVVLALVKGCRRHGTHQGKCISRLRRTFQVKKTKDFVPLLISLTPRENFDPDHYETTLHGCLIVEELLFFKNPIEIVISLLQIPEQDLVRLLCDTKGCHITDAFMSSKNVGEKKKESFFQRLRGFYSSLAISKHGSRSFDAIWSAIGFKQRASIAEEIRSKEGEVASTSYGKRSQEKIYLSHFKRNREEWLNIQKTALNAKRLFSDLVPKNRKRKH